MREDFDKPAAGPLAALLPDDGIPVLRDIVQGRVEADIPTLYPGYPLTPLETAPPDIGLSPERLAELADTLQLTLNRELDYAIDGAVYERLQTAMEEVAASVKQQVHAQLEQRLPELIEQTLRKEN